MPKKKTAKPIWTIIGIYEEEGDIRVDFHEGNTAEDAMKEAYIDTCNKNGFELEAGDWCDNQHIRFIAAIPGKINWAWYDGDVTPQIPIAKP